jgi:putative heme iron utilization protein
VSRDAHASPGAEPEEALYDPDVATPTPAERARTLLASASSGALGSVAAEPAGYPYGSFVTFALHDGDPVFCISELAEHTKNLRRDPRSSLLVTEVVEQDPLANGRVTLLGECRNLGAGPERDAARDAYLAAHPNARYYADFRDFSFWKLRVASLRWIGGYGRMSWVSVEDWRASEADPIAPAAPGIIAHMNDDHAQALLDYTRAFTRATDASAAHMTGVDRYGFEMSVRTARGPRPVRLAFSAALTTPEQVRREMVSLARRARELLAS